MKKEIMLAVFAFLFICTLTWDKASAKNYEQKITVAAFSEISLKIGANLYLEQGKKQSVKVVAKKSVLEELIAEVKDRKLIIRFPNKHYFMNDFEDGEISIYITVPEIDMLSISGSGNIIAEKKINSRIIDLLLSGSGNIELTDLTSDRVKVSIAGSGDMLLKGEETATDLSVSISGSGKLNATDFSIENVVAKIAGSGSCSVSVQENLKVKIAGSGSVLYQGNPQIDQTVVGAGTVKKLE